MSRLCECVRFEYVHALPSHYMSVGGWKMLHEASSNGKQSVCVCVCVHIDFPTCLFTAKGKLWLERKEKEQERKRHWEREGRQKTLSIWPSGEPARKYTQTQARTEAQTHWCKLCYFLVLFYSHSTVINNTSRTNFLTTSVHTHRCAFRQKHARRSHVKVWDIYWIDGQIPEKKQQTDRYTDRLPLKWP